MMAAGCVHMQALDGSIQDVSGDGRYVLTRTTESFTVFDDNDTWDLYRIDTTDGSKLWVSPSNGGSSAGDGAVWSGEMSDDGRYIAFSSSSTNLVASDTNGYDDIFIRDTVNLTTEALTAGNGNSSEPTISGDGSWVYYVSSATDLVSPATSWSNIFGWWRPSGTTELVSTDSSGNSTSGNFEPQTNYDGFVVVWKSSSSSLVMDDTNANFDVFVRWDPPTASGGLIIQRASTGPAGQQATGGVSGRPHVSGDGTHVTFESDATNLVSGDTNGEQDIFVKNLNTGAIERASVSTSGTQGTGESAQPWTTNDGRHIAFRTQAFELNGGIPGGWVTVVRDTETDTTTVMNTDQLGAPTGSGSGNSGSAFQTRISGDGNYVTVYDRLGEMLPGSSKSQFFRFVSNPTIDSIEPNLVEIGADTEVVILGSGFVEGLNHSLNTDLVNPGTDGIKFLDVKYVGPGKLSATVVVDNGVAPGSKQVNLIIDGTGPGTDNGAFAFCPNCMTFSN